MPSGTELVKACEEYLRMKHIFHYRQNTGALRTQSGGFIRFGTTGSPDIVAVIAGKYIGIECKMGSGKQSPGQKDFEKRLKQAGGEYWLIRDVQEVVAKIM